MFVDQQSLAKWPGLRQRKQTLLMLCNTAGFPAKNPLCVGNDALSTSPFCSVCGPLDHVKCLLDLVEGPNFFFFSSCLFNPLFIVHIGGKKLSCVAIDGIPTAHSPIVAVQMLDVSDCKSQNDYAASKNVTFLSRYSTDTPFWIFFLSRTFIIRI